MMWLFYILVVSAVFIIIYPAMRIMAINRIISGVITLLIIIGVVSLARVYVSPYVLAWVYERHLRLDYALVQIAEQKSPESFQNYLSSVKNKIIQFGRISQEDELQAASNFVNDLLVKYGPNASNPALYDYLKVNLAFDKMLFDQDPGLVLYHQFPEKIPVSQVNMAAINVSDYINHLFSNAEDVISTGTYNVQKNPSKDDEKAAMIIFRELVADLSKQYGAKAVVQVLENPQNSGVDQKLAATIVIAFYQKLLDMDDEAKAALFLRVTFMLNRLQP